MLATPVAAQATAGLAADPAGADGALAAARFDEARALYDGALFGPAARALARFRDAYPRDVRAPDAHCGWASESFFGGGQNQGVPQDWHQSLPLCHDTLISAAWRTAPAYNEFVWPGRARAYWARMAAAGAVNVVVTAIPWLRL